MGLSTRVRERLVRLRRRKVAAITNLTDRTSTDPSTGAVRSVQTADVLLAEPALREIWSAENLERLARTYWRFLARVTLGVVHVHYTRPDDSGGTSGRAVVLLAPALKLISFAEPEYEMDESHGLVRWRIQGGMLVAGPRRRGKAARDQGHLQITVRRLAVTAPVGGVAADAGGRSDAAASSVATDVTVADPAGADRALAAGPARLHVEIEVASFYPAIAFALSRRLYDLTQSRIHVLITHAFLRSLVRARGSDAVPRLAGSKVRRFAAVRDRRAGGGDSEPPAAQGA
jgi:hypothetical protein